MVRKIERDKNNVDLKFDQKRFTFRYIINLLPGHRRKYKSNIVYKTLQIPFSGSFSLFNFHN